MRLRYCHWSRTWLFASLLSNSLEVLGHPPSLQLDLALAHRPSQPASRRLLQRNSPLTTVTQAHNSFLEIIVNATVGTPPQPLQLMLAFDAGDTVVIAKGSEACTSNNCDLGTYDTNASSTYQYLNSNFSVNYADTTSVAGDYVEDVFTLGGTTIDNLQFGLSTNGTSVFESILGLGYVDTESIANSYFNLPARLYQDGTTKVNGFSVWFDGPNATTGKLALGSIDTGKFTGSLETFPVSLPSLQYSFTSIKLDSVSTTTATGTTHVDNSSTYVNLDAGVSGLSFPTAIFTQLVKFLESLGAIFDGGYLYQSHGTGYYNSTIDLTFGSLTFQIPLDHLTEPYNETHDAFLVFNSTSDSSNVLGVPFLRQAYSVFDYSHNQISLAPVLQSQKSNVTLIQENGVAGLTSTGDSTTASSAQPSTPSGTSNLIGSASPSAPTGHSLATSSKIGIGVGIGVGVPILLALAGGLFLVHRRKRGGPTAHPSSTAAELPATGGSGVRGVVTVAEKDGPDKGGSTTNTTTTGSNGQHGQTNTKIQSKHMPTGPAELPASNSQAGGTNSQHTIRRKPLSELL